MTDGPCKQDNTVMKLLEVSRVVSFRKAIDGFIVQEECDQYFDCHLTAEQLENLGKELIAMARDDVVDVSQLKLL